MIKVMLRGPKMWRGKRRDEDEILNSIKHMTQISNRIHRLRMRFRRGNRNVLISFAAQFSTESNIL